MIVCLGWCLFVVTKLWAYHPPQQVQTAFSQLYPSVTEVAWDKKGEWYIAAFIFNNKEKAVWFDRKAQWVMKETDVDALADIPQVVAEAYRANRMASMWIKDIRIIDFPKKPSVVAITVRESNSEVEFIQFYSLGGKLLQSLNATQLGVEIYPGLF
ncbi:MAG: hypothetical protein E7099_01065 [Mediterranea massiliensis]|nr:hypothetical protein [Mediterranea massiliensis]